MKLPYKQLLFLIPLLGIPVIAYVWIFIPAQHNFSGKQQEIAQKTEKLEKLKETMGEFANLDQQIDSLDNVLQHFESKLPSRMEIH